MNRITINMSDMMQTAKRINVAMKEAANIYEKIADVEVNGQVSTGPFEVIKIDIYDVPSLDYFCGIVGEIESILGIELTPCPWHTGFSHGIEYAGYYNGVTIEIRYTNFPENGCKWVSEKEEIVEKYKLVCG